MYIISVLIIIISTIIGGGYFSKGTNQHNKIRKINYDHTFTQITTNNTNSANVIKGIAITNQLNTVRNVYTLTQTTSTKRPVTEQLRLFRNAHVKEIPCFLRMNMKLVKHGLMRLSVIRLNT